MRKILTAIILLCTVAVSAQTTVVTHPKKKPTTVKPKPAPAKPKPAPAKPKPAPAKPKPSPVKPKATSGYENGHEWVDLGLSVKWATTNVGASSPEGYGNYYAWGETSTKSNYTWSNLKHCLDNSGDKFSKYVANSKYGSVDNKTTLDLYDDAARANWGGSWRMPTSDEQDELRNSCNWTWTTMNGVKGYKVVSKRNGNSIFLPAAGNRYDSGLYSVGSYGNYWSSSVGTSYSDYAYYLSFNSGSVDWFYNSRYYGRSVRPVCQ